MLKWSRKKYLSLSLCIKYEYYRKKQGLIETRQTVKVLNPTGQLADDYLPQGSIFSPVDALVY